MFARFRTPFPSTIITLGLTLLAGCSGGGSSAPLALASAQLSSGDPTLTQRDTTTLSSTWYASVVKSDAPLVFYRLNDITATTLADSSGQAHSASVTGSLAIRGGDLLAGSQSSNSAVFTNAYATESITSSVNAVSVEAWIRPTVLDLGSGYYSPRLVSNAWADHSGNGYMLWIDGGYAKFNAGYHSVAAPTPLVAGTVYHLVGTFDPTNVPNTVRLYINGALVGAIPSDWAPPSVNLGDSAVTYIGALAAIPQYGFVDYFQGNMAEVAVYEHALTPQRIAQHYQTGATPPGPVTASPTALTFTAIGAAAAKRITISQSSSESSFNAKAIGGDTSCVSVSVNANVVTVRPLHAGATSILISGANGQSANVPIDITSTTLTFN